MVPQVRNNKYPRLSSDFKICEHSKWLLQRTIDFYFFGRSFRSFLQTGETGGMHIPRTT